MAQRNERAGSRTAARAPDKRTRHFVKTGRARKSAKRAAVAPGEDAKPNEAGFRGRDPKPDSDID